METVKVVLVGESGVGKTSIISRFITDSFDSEVLSSSSAQFISKTIKLSEPENTTIKFDIWDTAGQERFRSLAKIFYKDAKIIIYVYDITDRKSFEEIKNYWYKETSENFIDNSVVLALVGNKSDLYENEQVSDEEGKKFADEIHAIFKITSALSNTGINWVFDSIGKKVLNPDFDYNNSNSTNQENYKEKRQKANNDNIKLNSNKGIQKKNGGCCDK